MGCGCRGGNKFSNAPVRKVLSLEELKAKVSGGIRNTPIVSSVPARVPMIISNPIPEPIFKTVQLGIDPQTVSTSKKTVLLVAPCNNAEAKYLKNVVTKLVFIKKEIKDSMDFIEIEPTYLLNSQDVTMFPCTILISKKSFYKKYFNLFDVQRALDEFLALNE